MMKNRKIVMSGYICGKWDGNAELRLHETYPNSTALIEDKEGSLFIAEFSDFKAKEYLTPNGVREFLIKIRIDNGNL